jgi:hypothetical protein
MVYQDVGHARPELDAPGAAGYSAPREADVRALDVDAVAGGRDDIYAAHDLSATRDSNAAKRRAKTVLRPNNETVPGRERSIERPGAIAAVGQDDMASGRGAGVYAVKIRRIRTEDGAGRR